LDRRVEPERQLGRRQVVVDRLGNADHLDALLEQLVGHAQRVLAPDCDEGVHPIRLQRLMDPLGPVRELVRVGPRGAQDRASPGQDPPAALHVQLQRDVLDDPLPPIGEADERVAKVPFALPNHGPDHCIEARAIPAAVQHADLHWPLLFGRNRSSGTPGCRGTLAMRRVLAALAAAAVLLPGASIARALPAGAASSSGYAPSPTAPAGGDASDARARRSDLLARIAALTDQMDGTQADVVAAELRQNEVDGQVAKAKARIRARAVAAYIRGLNTPGDMSTPAAYLEVAARKERELLSQFHDA